LTRVEVTRKGADRAASGHPWIFRSDLARKPTAGPGEVVAVVDGRGRVLGTAHHSDVSQIALRMLDAGTATVDRAFFADRIARAMAYRSRVVADTDAYRLVHGEADQLPGLVVDRYGQVLVVQLHSQGMDRAAADIVGALVHLLAPEAIVASNDSATRLLENLPRGREVVHGELAGPTEVRMNGLVWAVDPLAGQKTGLFLDQRENYVAVAKHARGVALDCFTCAGGFALHMAARCESVEGVDSSESAVATARANAERNGLANARFREADVFDLLPAYAASRRRFDTVVLDPPGFAKDRQSVEAALRAYREVNQRALRLLEPGGVLVTCSCSHHVSEADLLGVLAQAARDTERRLVLAERRTQAADHPVLLHVPETHYLKLIVAVVASTSFQ
jgi:23S rRNA (cytosine1962-C5)-methyltransferase